MSLRDHLRRLLRPSSSRSDERVMEVPQARPRPSARLSSSSPSAEPYSLESALSSIQNIESSLEMVREQRLNVRSLYELEAIRSRQAMLEMNLLYLRRLLPTLQRESAVATRPITAETRKIMNQIQEAVAGSEPVYTYTGEEAVAAIIADRAKASVDKISKEIESSKSAIKQDEETIKNRERRISTAKAKVSKLEDQYNKFIRTEREEFMADNRVAINRLKKDERVERFEVDAKGRVIVTTVQLSTKKEDEWIRARRIGQFQIRIDFKETDPNNAIRVLNIYKRYNNYDSPTISNTRCCWGNIHDDIQRDLADKDLYELVSDMIAYCMSPNDDDGYLGWEEWCSGARRQPANFSWEQYDQNEESKLVPGFSVNEDGTIRTHEDLTIASPHNFAQFEGVTNSWAVYSDPFADVFEEPANTYRTPYITIGGRQVDLTPAQSSLMSDLENFGFIPAAAYRLTVLMQGRNARRVSSFSLKLMPVHDDYYDPVNSRNNSLYALYYTLESTQDLSDLDESLRSEITSMDTMRLFVNGRDLTTRLENYAIENPDGISFQRLLPTIETTMSTDGETIRNTRNDGRVFMPFGGGGGNGGGGGTIGSGVAGSNQYTVAPSPITQTVPSELSVTEFERLYSSLSNSVGAVQGNAISDEQRAAMNRAAQALRSGELNIPDPLSNQEEERRL